MEEKRITSDDDDEYRVGRAVVAVVVVTGTCACNLKWVIMNGIPSQ